MLRDDERVMTVMMDGMMSGNMMDGMMGGGSGGAGGLFGGAVMFLMGIVPLLVIGLVVWLVVEAIRRNDASRQTSPAVFDHVAEAGRPERTARALLDERYARGEIDREEYMQRRADLGT
jgi:putative membrane protein